MNIDILNTNEEQEMIANQDSEMDQSQIHQLFEAFMNSSLFAISIIDKNHKIIRVNSEFAEYFEKPIHSFIGKHCFQESEKRNNICPHCPGTVAMLSGKTEKAEIQNIGTDGEPYFVRIYAIPYYNSDNEVAGFIEIVENTTERNKEREALLQSEERFKQVAEIAGEWIWEVDINGLFTYSSPVVEKILGYKLDEIVGKKHFYDFYTTESKEALLKESTEILNSQKSFNNFINYNIHKNGEIVILETSGGPVIDSNGNVCGYRGIDRDITERTKWEKQLQQTQEELIEASRRAGMSEVAADILHNVGNVLNSINVTTTVIKKTISNSEISNLSKVINMIDENLGNLDSFFENDPKGKYIPSYLNEVIILLTNRHEDIINKLKVLIEDIDHIKTIINTQQECTKISEGDSPVNINHVIENAIRINQASLKRHQIRLEKDCTDIGEININKNSVIQILVNLIANAKNALLESEVVDKVLTIRSYRHDNNFLRIEVIDNGIGISKENLSKLFQHGFTTRKDGHGFGLHSSALAAKDMNGTLTAQSEGFGLGAKFTLELPVKLTNSCWIDDKPVAVS